MGAARHQTLADEAIDDPRHRAERVMRLAGEHAHRAFAGAIDGDEREVLLQGQPEGHERCGELARAPHVTRAMSCDS